MPISKTPIWSLLRARSKVNGGSGKPLVEDWCHVFTVRNGKIVTFFEYLDTAPFAAEYKMIGARA